MRCMSDWCSIHATCADREVATRIAEALIAERLAACVNIVPGITSIYRWGGEICKVDEVLLIVKTRGLREQACIERIVALHPDRIPGITSTRIDQGHPPFLQWLVDETRKNS